MIAHIVHNPARNDRRKLLEQQCREQGITYQLHGAVFASTNNKGCHLAHNGIVAMAQQFNYASVLIMEDDIVFTAPGAFKFFMDNIPDEFDIYSGMAYGQAVKYNPDTGLIRTMSGTHIYIVHQRFYSRYLNMDIEEAPDPAMTKASKCIRLCMPMVALQRSGQSDMLHKFVDYNNDQWINYPLYENTIEGMKGV